MIKTLATDLDGTLIPLDDSREQQAAVAAVGQAVSDLTLELLFVDRPDPFS